MESRGGTISDLIRAFLSFFLERRRTKHFVELPEVVNRIVTTEKAIALTFDADLTPKMESSMHVGGKKTWYDEHLLATLETLKISATFFLSGKWMEAYPDITARIAENPLFELGNHGYSHAGFSMLSSPSPQTISEEKIDEDDVIKTEKILFTYPSSRRYFRFPMMTLSRPRVALVRRLGYFVIEGNINRPDIRVRHPAKLARNVIRHLLPGSIVILHFHDGPHAPATGAALPEIIMKGQKKGYRFLKLSDLMKLGRPSS